MILVKMTSIIEDSMRNEEDNSGLTEFKNGSEADTEQYDHCVIPVSNGRHRLLKNQEGYENVSLDLDHQRT